MHVFDVGEVTVVFITYKQLRSTVDSNPTGEIKGAGYKSRHSLLHSLPQTKIYIAIKKL